MRNQEKNTPVITIDEAIAPIVANCINFRDQRMLLHEMFTATVANAPDNETDNFTARRLSPFYLALVETLENLDSIPDIHTENILSCMARAITH